MGDNKSFKKLKRSLKNMSVWAIVAAMTFLIALGPIFLQPYYSAGLRRAAKDWPTTTATITKIYPERGNQIKRRYKFSYWVNDTNLTNMESADRYTSIFSRKPDGTKVEIHYNPERTNQIVVVQEDANVIYNRTKDIVFIGGGIVIAFGVLVVAKKVKDYD